MKKNGLANVFGKETCFFGLKDTLRAFGVNVCQCLLATVPNNTAMSILKEKKLLP